jgi:hypothetical protein
MMKKIISFSLYGGQQKYSYGMISNVEIAQVIFPDWICRIYYGKSVPSEVIEQLRTYSNVELYLMDEGEEHIFPMMWRFLAIDDEDVEVMISRDADARLSYREKHCVDIFMESEFLLHSIRDNPSHNNIMGGMWGIKKNNRVKMNELSKDWKGHYYDSDQKFLREKLVPLFNDSYLIHCSTYLKTFPIEKTNEYFVGGWWDENNFGKPQNYIFF